MELDELVHAWRAQDTFINKQLQTLTLSYLLKEKSTGVLSKLVKRLTIEVLVLIALAAGSNLLFFITDLPYTISRWICFGIFNLVAAVVIAKYVFTIRQVNRNLGQDMRTALEQIVKTLNRFRWQNQHLHLPIGIICIGMFAGSQNLIYWLPWLLIEFLLWHWVFIPSIRRRFESYLVDLEYSLAMLKDTQQ